MLHGHPDMYGWTNVLYKLLDKGKLAEQFNLLSDKSGDLVDPFSLRDPKTDEVVCPPEVVKERAKILRQMANIFESIVGNKK